MSKRTWFVAAVALVASIPIQAAGKPAKPQAFRVEIEVQHHHAGTTRLTLDFDKARPPGKTTLATHSRFMEYNSIPLSESAADWLSEEMFGYEHILDKSQWGAKAAEETSCPEPLKLKVRSGNREKSWSLCQGEAGSKAHDWYYFLDDVIRSQVATAKSAGKSGK